ncbi:hypothetical protein EH31_10380 [Erythrobacter longus]|uniref:DUF4136 domain-containing protein n=1 Tax=Erythrobacter longus TaxID=1044 RepID=A0A074MCJ0_ERYLO|nr:DUF4136 domain-containing protein [Erythrobacter longus]KEO90485.1 hypothetical protein EH31_10380 [Erythrobacter longus]
MTLRTVLTLAAALSLAGCATSGRIFSDYDQTQSFADYKTFAWAGEAPMVSVDNRAIPPMVTQEVAEAIKSDLTARGYVFTQDVARADFAVSFTIGTRDGVNSIQVPDYFMQSRAAWTWGTPYWPRIPTMPATRTELREYTEGTLAIDIYDVGRKAPVWHGTGQRNLTRAELRGESNTAAQDVKLILAEFPPS